MSVKPVSSRILEDGQYEIGGVPVRSLVEEFGTPLYVLDKETLKVQCQAYTKTLDTHYPNYLMAYACKENIILGLVRFFQEEGLGFDVCSGGELYTVMKAGVSADQVVFHGNNKSDRELSLAIEHGIKIVLDNDSELRRISALLDGRSETVSLIIRLKPEIEAHTHEYIKTGQIDSKFGVSKDELISLIKKVDAHPQLCYVGIHSHIGSQIFDTDPYHDLVDLMVDTMCRIRQETGLETEVLDLGGGFGIQYIESDDPPEIPVVLEQMIKRLKALCQENDYPEPFLILEPGRSITATAGVTLYTVGVVKSIPGIKEYLFVDGGMADNPRPIMYQADYSFELANKLNDEANHSYTIAGKFCESGDVLAHDVMLAKAEEGDLVVVYGTGAYNYSMSSNYNRYCRPAMVMVGDGQAKEVVKRETYDDLIRNDI